MYEVILSHEINLKGYQGHVLANQDHPKSASYAVYVCICTYMIVYSSAYPDNHVYERLYMYICVYTCIYVYIHGYVCL